MKTVYEKIAKELQGLSKLDDTVTGAFMEYILQELHEQSSFAKRSKRLLEVLCDKDFQKRAGIAEVCLADFFVRLDVAFPPESPVRKGRRSDIERAILSIDSKSLPVYNKLLKIPLADVGGMMGFLQFGEIPPELGGIKKIQENARHTDPIKLFQLLAEHRLRTGV